MVKTSQDLIEKSQALIRPLADLCTEMLRQDPIRIVDRHIVAAGVISNEDLQAHFDVLMSRFLFAIDRHEQKPSFPSAIVLAAMAVQIQERSVEIATWPSPTYQSVLVQLKRAEQVVTVSGPSALASVMRRIWYGWYREQKADDLRRRADAGKPLTISLPKDGGVVLTADDNKEEYRFAKLVLPTHTCGVPGTLSGGQRVTLTGVELGEISFTAGCACNYIATDEPDS
jgi:hypothetical protein